MQLRAVSVPERKSFFQLLPSAATQKLPLIILEAERESEGGRQDEDLQPAQSAAPPVASISHQTPQYGWSREVALSAGPGNMIKEPAA